jgi:hypothetical protein
MTAPDPASGSATLALDQPAVVVGRGDILCSLLSFALGTAVLVYAMSPAARYEFVLALYLGVLLVPATFWLKRRRQEGELTLAVLLLITTCAAGPIGALGCTFLALSLWRRQPAPERLRHWYEYISGIVARGSLARIYEELRSGRLPSDVKAEVPRFRPLLRSASVEEQQRVLGVLGRHYHAQFRAALRDALRNRNGFIRAQAAAVAARLDAHEKMRLWSTSGTSAEASEPAHNDVIPQNRA